MAAETAEEAIKLLKADPAPTETAAKEKYTSTLLAGLSIRAEALSLVAVYLDRTQAGAAETAYREYLAIESDSAKKMSAEHKLATMFHQLKELEKAKSVYENLLARNPNDTRALAAMVSIYRDIAAAQNMAGQNAEAETSNKLAKSYSDRLSDLNSPAKADAPVETWDTEKPRNVDRRIETKTDTSRPKVEPAGEKKGPIIRRP
jgi:tetratricopeptide (TPR) repeat protein